MSNDHQLQRAFLYLLSSIVLSACAQLLMKAGMIALAAANSNGEMAIVDAVMSNSQIPGYILSGLACYAVSMLAWLLALTRYQLSLAYPLLGMSYVLVYLGAVFWPRIGEEFSLLRSGGILLVFVGVILVNYKEPRSARPVEERESNPP
jgi:undecaprenyl phosphate-alpha-L-ara4N flippase subunit ArnF